MRTLASLRGRATLTDWALPAAILLMAVLIAIAEPGFLSSGNLIGIVRQVALIGIMASCMTFVIMTGGVDLSVGPVLALSGLLAFFALDAGLPLPVVILAGLSAGLVVGLLNGLIRSVDGYAFVVRGVATKVQFLAKRGKPETNAKGMWVLAPPDVRKSTG